MKFPILDGNKMSDNNLNFKDDVLLNHYNFSRAFLKILDKNMRVSPLRLNPVQKDIIKNMTDKTIILKGRQQGVSTLMQSLLYRLALTRTIKGLVLSHDDRSTQAFRRMFSRFNDHMPAEYKPEFGYNNRTIISLPATDSEIIVATANGTGNVGRGFSFSHIHFSEYAFVNDPEPMLAGALQSGNPNVVIESTANGTGNDFYTKCMEAHHGEGIWKLLFYQWWLSPEYQKPLDFTDEIKLTNSEEILVQKHTLSLEQIKWRRYKIKELGARLFNQEYPETVELAFLASGVGYFSDIENLDELLTAKYDTEPNSDKTYIAGLDLGRNIDYTVLSVFDLDTGNEVDLLRINRMSWNSIIERIVQKLRYWNVDTIWIENNNVGNAIPEQLLDMLEENPDVNTNIRTFNSNSRTKPQLVNRFHNALENREILLLPDTQGRQELTNFTATQNMNGNWQFKASAGHDDIVIARMLAIYGMYMHGIKLLEFV